MPHIGKKNIGTLIMKKLLALTSIILFSNAALEDYTPRNTANATEECCFRGIDPNNQWGRAYYRCQKCKSKVCVDITWLQ